MRLNPLFASRGLFAFATLLTSLSAYGQTHEGGPANTASPVANARTSQEVAALAARTPRAQVAFQGKARPGSLPGTEKWIVHFRTRPVALDAMRAEMHGPGRPAEIAKLIADAERRMRADQASFVKDVEALGGKVFAQWWLVSACAIEIAPEHLATIRKLDKVDFVQPDVEVTPGIKTATNSSNHNADALQAKGIRGAGIAVAILDTGQDSNMAGTGRPHITYSRRGTSTTRLVVNRKIGLMSADDVHGHGTGVASIAAGYRWKTSTADHGHAYDANIAGYAIANALNGNSSTATMASAYQHVASDAAARKIRVTNLSYHGSPNPLSVEQKMMDALSNTFDILNVTIAGNNGTNTSNSLINVNGVSVGAVYENSHTRWASSCRGTTDGQIFPDMVANGVNTNMARRNKETADYIASGTSMAGPQVAGAATLLRDVNPTMRSYETKAVLLASTSTCQYTTSVQSNSGPGCGYLRDDVAHRVATDSDRHGRASVGNGVSIWRRLLPVVRGRTYQFAIAWPRLDTNRSTWTNLELVVRSGNSTIARSITSRNTEEFVRFVAPRTEHLTVQVSWSGAIIGSTAQVFGWASLTDTLPKIAGEYTTYGLACPGSSGGGGVILPAAYATKMGNSSNTYPHSYRGMRYQQVFARNEVGISRTFNELCLRLDEARGGPWQTQRLTIKLGYTLRDYTNLSSSFASNPSGPMRTVFSGNVTFHYWNGGNYSPTRCTICIPISNWAWDASLRRNLLVEIINTSTSSPGYQADFAAASDVRTSRLWARSATATSGTVNRQQGLIMCLRSSTARARPILANADVPRINDHFRILLARAKPNSAAALIWGVSRTRWGPVPLPLHLVGAGAPTCYLNSSYEILLGAAPTSSSGTAVFLMGLPSELALVGTRFYNQWFVIDRGANTLGISFSNGGAAKIGR